MFFKMTFLIYFTFSIVTGCESQWSNWEATDSCPDYCGGGFNSTFIRTCLNNSTACPCLSGPTTITKPCNQNVCKYPRNSCFGSLKPLVSNGEIICTNSDSVNISDPYPDRYPCCPPEGIWGSWIETSTCNDTCGGYGTLNRRRICLTEAAGCPCLGESTQISIPCNTMPCKDRPPCAIGFSLSVVGGFIICVKSNESDAKIKKLECCPTFGVWEQWSSWSTCSSTCGGCAQASRSRSCASEKYGCPCNNSTPTTETQTCNRNVCFNETNCCSPLIPFNLSNGEVLCFPPSLNIPVQNFTTTTSTPRVSSTVRSSVGEWSEWSVASCTESCGLCGTIIKIRICQNGNKCIGENQKNTTQICGGPSLCPLGFGLPSCCEPANRAIVNNKYRCIIPS